MERFCRLKSGGRVQIELTLCDGYADCSVKGNISYLSCICSTRIFDSRCIDFDGASDDSDEGPLAASAVRSAVILHNGIIHCCFTSIEGNQPTNVELGRRSVIPG